MLYNKSKQVMEFGSHGSRVVRASCAIVLGSVAVDQYSVAAAAAAGASLCNLLDKSFSRERLIASRSWRLSVATEYASNTCLDWSDWRRTHSILSSDVCSYYFYPYFYTQIYIFSLSSEYTFAAVA